MSIFVWQKQKLTVTKRLKHDKNIITTSWQERNNMVTTSRFYVQLSEEVLLNKYAFQ